MHTKFQSFFDWKSKGNNHFYYRNIISLNWIIPLKGLTKSKKQTNKHLQINERYDQFPVTSDAKVEFCPFSFFLFFFPPRKIKKAWKLVLKKRFFWKDDFGGGENTSSTSKSNKQFREFLTNASSEIFVRLFPLFLLIIASKYFRYKSGRLGGGLTVGGWGASIINDWLYSARKLHFARAFCCVWARVNARIEPERIISPDCAYTLPYSSISDSFFILSSFFPFSTSVLFKNIPRLKSNEFIFSNWRRKADIGFIISLFPFYSPYIRFDSFRICFRLFFFISR